MAKVDMSGASRTDNQRVDSTAKRNDYCAPKLTVVGTVHDLTLALNDGAPDGEGGGTQQGG